MRRACGLQGGWCVHVVRWVVRAGGCERAVHAWHVGGSATWTVRGLWTVDYTERPCAPLAVRAVGSERVQERAREPHVSQLSPLELHTTWKEACHTQLGQCNCRGFRKPTDHAASSSVVCAVLLAYTTQILQPQACVLRRELRARIAQTTAVQPSPRDRRPSSQPRRRLRRRPCCGPV